MPLLKRALGLFCHEEISLEEGLGWLPLACRICADVWDDQSWSVLSARLIELARDAGALRALPAALASGVTVQLLAGEPAQAAVLAQQAEGVSRAARQAPKLDGPLMLAAWQGRDGETGQLIAAATRELAARGEGQWLTTAAWAAAVLHNGLSHYEEALAAAERASAYPGELAPASWSLAELIEAAARTGQPGRAAAALERLSAATSAAGTDWALGLQARCRALLSEGEAAERGYLEAIERLGRTRVRAELARAYLLYGEWPRRENRRTDAREQLRAAHQMLATMRIEGFAERARLELLATGETIRRRTPETAAGLTPQEARIAGSPWTGTPTRRSASSCSSARARSSGTCARCSRNWASAPGRNSRWRCPALSGPLSRPKPIPLPAAEGQAAVDADRLTGHLRGGVGGQEDGHRGRLVRGRGPTEREAVHHLGEQVPLELSPAKSRSQVGVPEVRARAMPSTRIL